MTVTDPHTAPAGISTRSVHSGAMPESHTGSVVAPIFQTSTFMMDTPGETRAGFDYARTGTPNRSDLEDVLCELENASFAAAVNSGTSAEVAVFSALLGPGDEIIIPRDIYGGTYRLLVNEYVRWGVTVRTVDLTDTEALAAAINDKTAIVWVETPSNPGLDIVDIEATAKLAHQANAILAVDSTFATPCLQRPIDLGADVVIHSTTKFINGHSDVIGGAVLAGDGTSCAKAAEVVERLDSYLASVGLGISPFDAWLTRRGIKTLPVRMKAHCENAQAVAEWLEGREEIAEVYYPGLPSHPGHEVAKRQMSGFGGVVSLRTDTGARALALVQNTKLITLAESLGGVESLIDHPATMTHLAVADCELSVSGAFIRLSVGIEDIDDILADLDQALAATATVSAEGAGRAVAAAGDRADAAARHAADAGAHAVVPV
ncbi:MULTISPECIES: aminotransferase class I/II-fold pyridoxal phosphate-dependent enzyme [unclassified Brevibacterium]|uniref:trans-sulfuration enzyme family protein n=1 Tax=unclassified Brevibacterium TaxID=2614124 RepID=UPI001E492142|nr:MULTISPECIES: aminotransferase class I/II-fold pyridoxal phosphate-dependent enzyme [unclassified Brevibacterium]MCD1286623.1 cystathionine gamma-synthase [Brevibacterium sp. CCUG 69071]MDK8434146.1 aminotransferase class I/II-fold pyridoxal phosphate-dependent enzyme [Brevibacterium sp. H-BE7]